MLGDEHLIFGIDLLDERFETFLEFASQLVTQRRIKAGAFFATRPKLGKHVLLGRIELWRRVHVVSLPRSVDAIGDCDASRTD
jgi:hypothetical protein